MVRVQGNVPRQAGTGAVGRGVVSLKPDSIAATFVSLPSVAEPSSQMPSIGAFTRLHSVFLEAVATSCGGFLASCLRRRFP